VIIDGDIVAYTAAASVQYSMDWGDGTYTNVGNADEALMLVGSRIDEICNSFGGAQPVVALSCEGNYFRHILFDKYKSNRVAAKPVVLKALRELMEKNFQTTILPRLEADDVLGILATGGIFRDPIIYSEDKDLDQIPCLRAKTPGVTYRVTEREADFNHLLLSFAGDPTDGFGGCPRVGPKTAKRILQPFLDGTRDMVWAWEEILKRYKKAGLSEGYALTMARIARVVRANDYDKDTTAVTLWEPPC
jgi:DNA polymerase-1